IANGFQALLDAFPVPCGIVDRRGIVAHVNHSWMRAGAEASRRPAMTEVGAACPGYDREADVAGDPRALAAARGIRSVVEGGCERFDLRYTIDAAEGPRDATLVATAIDNGTARSALVAHFDASEAAPGAQRDREEISARKQAEGALAESNSRHAALI